MRLTILLIIALVLSGCGGNVPNIQPKALDLISQSAADWLFMHGSGNPPLQQEPSGILAFNIPNAPAALGYLQTPARLTTAPQAISLTFRVEATNAVYNAAIFSSTNNSTDSNPATFHPFLERSGDDLTKENYRWWPDIFYVFGSADNQTITLQIPLTSEHWTNVFGQHNAAEFSATLRDLGYVGMTFGGHNFDGHGIQMTSGLARFVLLDYSFSGFGSQ
jgi:hypothetical protein